MQLLDFYKNVLHLTDEALIDEVIRATEIKVLKRGDFLIRAGQLPTHACFLMKGIIRGTMLDCNGRDITDCIAYRCGSTVMPDNDYTQPASIALEALTDCEIICISLDVVNSLLERSPSVTKLYCQYLLISANLHRKLKIVNYQYTAAQRYEWFLREYPGLIDQVSHKYIASLLNMTPVTLSKIRKVLKDGGNRDSAPETPATPDTTPDLLRVPSE